MMEEILLAAGTAISATWLLASSIFLLLPSDYAGVLAAGTGTSATLLLVSLIFF